MRWRIDLGFYGHNNFELSLCEMKPFCDQLAALKQDGKCAGISQIIDFKRCNHEPKDDPQMVKTSNGMDSTNALYQVHKWY
jgi:hypothetical protein